MMKKQKNILLLCAEEARHTGTVDLHIRAFKDYSDYNVVTLDSNIVSRINVDIDMFDVIVFHYSIVISLPQYISDELGRKISAFTGPKILFIQDEFRWVNRTMKAAEELGVSVVFTVVNKDVIRKIYRNDYFDNVRFEQTLTGFVPENLLDHPVPDYMERPLDIGYRARKLPAWCGSFSLQKWLIGEKTLVDAKKYDLQCDIAMSEASRIYGDDWISFMSSCRATLGTESGASFVDYTGLVHQEIDKYEAAHPNASFEEVRDIYLEGRDGEVVIHVISPRVFEAAALRVLMILYPGTYSGALEAGRHFVELQPDHSNMDEVVAILRDPNEAGAIIQRAYDEVACSTRWTFRTFIKHFDDVVCEELLKHTSDGGAKSGNIAKMIIERTAELEAAQMAEFKRLEVANQAGAQRAQKRMQFILLLQRSRVAAFEFVDKKLPNVFSVPLLLFARAVSRRVKPILRKILQ